MQPFEFVKKWQASTLKESAAAQSHFHDLCDLIGVAKPADEDVDGSHYTFEKQTAKDDGRIGFADVWKKGHFAWEYKGPGKDLDAAYRQLQRYKGALGNPPLLVVSDTKTIRIYTDWTNYVTEVHEIALEDLLDQKKRDLLKSTFENPSALRPRRSRDELTRDAANEFSALAQRLRDRGHAPHTVAHFVNRLVFCMFAEDVNLLPNKLFQRSMELAVNRPEEAQENLRDLFKAMNRGGRVGFEAVKHFNGGLFDDDTALPLEKDDVKDLVAAAKLDWSEIDPSIFGTLFERGLDPSKRSQLGAHYTDAEKIMMIVEPVIIEPLTAEWLEVKEKIEAELAKAAKGKGAVRTRAKNKAEKLHKDFIEQLANFRVLDPACGSGNFLYLSLKALKDIEQRANSEAEDLGLAREFPRVGPENVLGIEINSYAAELARVSIWIGDIQWMQKKGFGTSSPILRPLDNIENRDALIEQDAATGEWREAEWPEADVIVGNPPFLGDRKMIGELGEQYVSNLRKTFEASVPGGADLVCYWFGKAHPVLEEGLSIRCGLVATNSIRGGANRKVIDKIVRGLGIFRAWSDEPWVVDGAAVRVSVICFGNKSVNGTKLDGVGVKSIASDLTTNRGFDLTRAAHLSTNQRAAFIGSQKNGAFDLPGEKARAWLRAPRNPNGRTNADVLRPWSNGASITKRDEGKWIIDFGCTMGAEEAALFELPFEHVVQKVRPNRLNLRREWHRTRWWLHGDPRPAMRAATTSFSRQILTPRVSKHRLFVWRPTKLLPDSAVVAIAREDNTTFGILHSRFHELWSLRMGTSLEDRPRYTPTTCFETFPFPEGLTPDIPADQYTDDPRAIRIADAAKRLNTLRENWLNPEDLIVREPEVVEGYPDRILPKDEEAAKILKKRTLTNLYNERPAWLDHAHAELDAAVAAAYGWEQDWEAGMDEEEILKRLFDLNQSRATSAH
ncbi:MAG: class I SAM-dependent DNA methyltransferase [Pseudomonadota bacterium]